VHRQQPRKCDVVNISFGRREQIKVADMWIESALDERPVKVNARELVAEDASDRDGDFVN
jgi:hypothetical protein